MSEHSLYHGKCIICPLCHGLGKQCFRQHYLLHEPDDCTRCGGAGRVKVEFKRLPGFEKPEDKE